MTISIPPETKPKKLGQMARDTEGRLVLVNPDGKAYAVDNDLSAVWSLLDGETTYQELIESLTHKRPDLKEEIDQLVKHSLSKLSSVSLVELFE